jgi:hypothetical protein
LDRFGKVSKRDWYPSAHIFSRRPSPFFIQSDCSSLAPKSVALFLFRLLSLRTTLSSSGHCWCSGRCLWVSQASICSQIYRCVANFRWIEFLWLFCLRYLKGP